MLHECFGDLFLACAAVADDCLFDAKGGVFEDGEISNGSGCDCGATGGSEDLSGLEILNEDGLF